MTSEPLPPATGSVADAYPPPEIAARVCKLGLAKVNTAVPTMVALAVLAGAFISLGALFYTVTITVGNEGRRCRSGCCGWPEGSRSAWG